MAIFFIVTLLGMYRCTPNIVVRNNQFDKNELSICCGEDDDDGL